MLPSLLHQLFNGHDKPLIREVIVADGGSTDHTCKLASSLGAVVVHCDRRGRAVQMNTGAALAKGEILYFLHADTRPPEGFADAVLSAITQGGEAGCFRIRFDGDPHPVLQFSALLARFPLRAFRFGDQSLFVKKDIFHILNGFRPEMMLLEDNDLASRLIHRKKFEILPLAVTTSSRKYRQHGVWRLQSSYILIYLMYKAGVDQRYLVKAYKRLCGN